MILPLTVDLTIGADTWAYTAGDPPDFGMADGLKITRTLPDSDFWPVQPNPAVAQFGLILEDFPADDITELGLPVALEVTDSEGLIESFYGRVAAVAVSPVMLGPATVGGAPRPAVFVAYQAVDYNADLAELVPNVTIDNEQIRGNVIQIMAGTVETGVRAIGFTPFWLSPADDGDAATNGWVGEPGDWDAIYYPERVASEIATAALLEEVLFPACMPFFSWDSWGLADIGHFRWVVQPAIDAGLLDTLADTVLGYWEAWPVYNKTRSLIGTHGVLPDGSYGIIPVVSTVGDATLVLDAGYVDKPTEWTRRKGDAIDQVAFTLDPVTSAETGGAYAHGVVSKTYPAGVAAVAGKGTARRDGLRFTSETSGAELNDWLENMGAVYLPGLELSDWGLNELTWRRSRDTAAAGCVFPALLGSHELVCVTNILDPWTPRAGRTWATGQVTSRTFTIASGEAVSSFTLKESPIAAASGTNPDPVTWADIPAGVEYQELSTDRYFEYGYITN